MSAPAPDALAALAAEVAERSGLGPPAPRPAAKLHDGVLSEVHLLERAGRAELVLKLYRFDLGHAVEADPDPRFLAASRHLSIPPFFASSRERIAALGRGARVALPEILGERVAANGTPYTLMTRVAGSAWSPARARDSAARRRLAAGMGSVLRGLHDASRGAALPALDARGWAEEYEALLHAIADHLPAPVVRGPRERWRLRLALQDVVERFAASQAGRAVLAHGDYGPDNVLVDDGGELVGLVDFQLSCAAPAAMDLRWVAALDARAFLDAYGWSGWSAREACWLGIFFQMLFEGLILVTLHRYSGLALPDAMWRRAARRFHALVRGLRAG